MSDFIPLKVRSDYSYLKSISRPYQIAQKTIECGYSTSGLIDITSLAGSLKIEKAFGNACKSCGHPKDAHSSTGECLLKDVKCSGFEKCDIKYIIGQDIYLSNQDCRLKNSENKELSSLTLIAKNKAGWLNLCKITSECNLPENFYYKPRIDFSVLNNLKLNDIICTIGAPNSHFSNIIFNSPKIAYEAASYEDAKSQVKDWKVVQKELLDNLNKYKELFGPENVFLELNLMGADLFPAKQIVGKILRWLAKETSTRIIGAINSYYPSKSDFEDEKIILCSSFNTTLEGLKKKSNYGSFESNELFSGSNYIPDSNEIEFIYTQEEIFNTKLISEMCERYTVSSPPRLPHFKCENGKIPEDTLLELCRVGWDKKLKDSTPQDEWKTYGDRVKKELGVLNGVGLASYFLIIHDICRYAQNELNCLPSPGRGSSAGCLVSYLLNITDCDPIKYNLLFERFYNPGRNVGTNISLPDIDCDFPVTKREQVIQYIRDKFGHNKTAQIATFGRFKGKSVIKEILRANSWGSYNDRNQAVKYIPDDAAISDDLQEMQESNGESSSILWALEHCKDELKDYCHLDESGNLEGPLKSFFEQGLRLEGVKRSQGRHAAGIIISDVELSTVCPMIFDKSTEKQIVGVEHTDAEGIGLLKADILGVAILSKIAGGLSTIKTGRISGE